MRFRPCIDLHDGRVKQIVGSSLSDHSTEAVETNFVADKSPAYYARLYRDHGLIGGHVIMLGKGNEEPAREALAAYPGGLQVGGGINSGNAESWLQAGADKVIVTSAVFKAGRICWDALEVLQQRVGAARLVLDLSCRFRDGDYYVVTDRWQTFTSCRVNRETFQQFEPYCSEFLIHAVDVEGKQQGMDPGLIARVKQGTALPLTYAGGIRNLDDLLTLEALGEGRIDATVGSCLDIFGGQGMTFAEAVEFDRQRRSHT